MAFEFEKFKSFTDDGIEEARGQDVGLTDYIFDVPLGIVKGASQAIEGLLTMGAMPIDYLANTNLISNIENLFDKITPDTNTALGDITSVLVQFGVPYAGALKLANGMSKLKGLSTMTKLSAPGMTRASQGMELAKRAGYFGGVGGVTDFAVSTPSKLGTLSDFTGLTEQTDFEGLEGSERAIETLKGKLKFGAEGAVVGGAVTLLPQAASVGFRYGILPALKPIAYAGGKILEYGVNAPLTKGIDLLVGTKGEKNFLKDLLISGGNLAESAGKKIGLLDEKGLAKDWRHTPIEGGLINTIQRGLTRAADQFRSPVAGEIKYIQESALAKLDSQQKTLKSIGGSLESKMKDIVNNYKIKFDDGESLLKLQIENNKVKQYILAVGEKNKTLADDILETIPKDLREDTKLFTEAIMKTQDKYKLFMGGLDGTKAAVLDFDVFMKQNFAAFNNKRFKFNPLIEKGVVKFFKDKIILNNPNTVKQLNVIAKETGKTVDDLATQQAKDQVLNFKQNIIKSDQNPETLFNYLRDTVNPKGIKSILSEGEQVPDIMKRFLSVEEGRTVGELTKAGAKDTAGKAITKEVETTNSIIAGLNVVLAQGKQMYGKSAYDSILKAGLNTPLNPNGVIHTAESILRKRIKDGPGVMSNLQEIGRRERLTIPQVILDESELFQGKYFTTPEIANALTGTKEITAGLYTLPLYKSLMSIKAGAQISKTILSPMTQVRNFTTAALFPVANGLIGGRIGFKDAWSLTGQDIFQGLKTDVEKIAKIERIIERQIVDQNINVQEMKRVLERAKDGKISFNKMMNTNIMQKLTDIYQGADNFWKIYSDNFYQGSLKTAFGDPTAIITGAKQGTKAFANEQRFFKDIDEWFKTVTDRKFNPVNELTGAAKTPLEAIEEASAYLVTNTIPTYSKVPRIVENIRNLPLGNFVAFPAEILRTSSNILMIGAKELTSTNPFIRQMGAKRLVGLSTVLGGLGYTTKKGAQYLTGVDDETMNAFQNSFAPPYQKNSTLVPLTAPDSEGRFKYYNFSYSNPYDTLVQPVNAILSAYGEGRLKGDSTSTIVMDALFGGGINPNKRKGAIVEFLTPFISESIGTERAVDVTIRGGKDSRGKTIYYKDLDAPDVIIAKSLNHILGGLTPGAVTSATRIWDGATQRFTDYGTQRDMASEVVALMSGVRIEEAKPLSSVPFILTSFNGDKDNMRSKFAKKAYSARTRPEEKLGAYKQYLLESYNSQNKMYQTIQDAEKLGVDTRKLKELFSERLTKSEVEGLFRGIFKVPGYSKNAFEAAAKRLENEDPFSSGIIQDQNGVVMDILDDIKRDLRRFDLGQSDNLFNSTIDELLSPGVVETRELLDQTVAPTGGDIFQSQVSLPVDPRKNVAVSPQVTNTGGQVMANANLGSRYLNGIDYNRMNTAQKADYVDKVFKV
jgi:hypothetical protein